MSRTHIEDRVLHSIVFLNQYNIFHTNLCELICTRLINLIFSEFIDGELIMILSHKDQLLSKMYSVLSMWLFHIIFKLNLKTPRRVKTAA